MKLIKSKNKLGLKVKKVVVKTEVEVLIQSYWGSDAMR